mmetsp:Transcript_71394/g.126117  ORF Transcript_71394/g.126117 Transcript_71394/m.126117 type:complete len:244 (-) Transcript_71394:42-773(-)|eukprot:CAMPEP_0197653044 /NCGR_PEP_ID=MMETSP1338-20131121/34816_1 /TAXON_ID=43686 ORGANISM="Pelagodinium beii, Strain RCC1491" /NCGR_SAMPLE_ID=MMETSP1338 /ASSEMBLY_ACC=CAM_ASM_000754 /LENGTH=243 /DNA_ID=CAMNT_0043228041 /DNA_START=65 /DNA_END=796 /DNA_ORIENTATION=+
MAQGLQPLEPQLFTPDRHDKMDKVCCGTPMSEASTAPPTPAGLVPLPSPAGHARFARLGSVDSDSIEEEIAMEDMEEPMLPSLISEEAVICLGLPVLQSELALWAAAEVKREMDAQRWAMKFHAPEHMLAEEDEEDEEDEEVEDLAYAPSEATTEEPEVMVPVACIGLPPMKSDLGRWAREEVRKEELAREQVSTASRLATAPRPVTAPEAASQVEAEASSIYDWLPSFVRALCVSTRDKSAL